MKSKIINGVDIVLSTGCWEWRGSKDSYGYGHIRVNGKLEKAHRYSYKIFIGPIPDGLLVCHRCDNPPCVKPEHLFLGTHLDNSRDRDLKGRACIRVGSKINSSKIDEELASKIKVSLESGKKQFEIANELKLSRSIINRIALGKTWKHI
jgi:hypothetical protein